MDTNEMDTGEPDRQRTTPAYDHPEGRGGYPLNSNTRFSQKSIRRGRGVTPHQEVRATYAQP